MVRLDARAIEKNLVRHPRKNGRQMMKDEREGRRKIHPKKY